jgi:hypothetical protein
MAVTPLKINIFKLWDCGCKPKVVPRSQLGVKMKPAVDFEMGVPLRYGLCWYSMPYSKVATTLGTCNKQGSSLELW